MTHILDILKKASITGSEHILYFQEDDKGNIIKCKLGKKQCRFFEWFSTSYGELKGYTRYRGNPDKVQEAVAQFLQATDIASSEKPDLENCLRQLQSRLTNKTKKGNPQLTSLISTLARHTLPSPQPKFSAPPQTIFPFDAKERYLTDSTESPAKTTQGSDRGTQLLKEGIKRLEKRWLELTSEIQSFQERESKLGPDKAEVSKWYERCFYHKPDRPDPDEESYYSLRRYKNSLQIFNEDLSRKIYEWNWYLQREPQRERIAEDFNKHFPNRY